MVNEQCDETEDWCEDAERDDADGSLVYRAEAYISRRRGMLPADEARQIEAAKILLKETRVKESLEKNLLPERVDPPLIHTQQPALPTLEASLPHVHLPHTNHESAVNIDSATLTTLVNEVSRNISRHLNSELPELLYNATLSTLEADLRRGIAAATEVAARNFIAQRLRVRKQR